ncbi:MAG TPA: dihydropteroate synthase [Thermoanaerobaculia bacterium]|nr:dihydropteroate synthase [Thermoanaerobaculia bacterium]
MKVSEDLVIPAASAAELAEIASWDGFRPATYPASEFPVDVVRFEGSSSPPVVLSRARRAESLKALPGTLRSRAQEAFDRVSKRPGRLALAHGRSLDFSQGPAVMGILNVTPDSFSDGGMYLDAGRAVERALQMFEDGAAIVDVGGESTRPATYGESAEVSAEEELRRVIPVLEVLRSRTEGPISIDTRKAAVAREAVAAGADLVNDVSALRFDPEMAGAVAGSGAAAILMHMKGTDPRTMQIDVTYAHPIADVASHLARAATAALEAGIAADRIAVDPGFGFGKSPEGNLVLLRHLAAFRSLGFAVAAGASRKAFVRRFSGVPETASAAERLPGSLACLAAAARAGASILRVHDVAESARFLRMLAAVETPTPKAARPPVAAAAP